MEMDLIQSGYQAALEAAAYRRLEAAGYLRIAGADPLGFMQRQTTNDIRLLAPGRAVRTALTSPAARMLDVLCLLTEAPAGAEAAAIGAIPLEGRAAATARFLKSRIFFMDKIEVRDQSADIAQFRLVGPQVAPVLAGLGLQGLPGGGEAASAAWQGAALRVLSGEAPLGPGRRLVVPAGAAAELEVALAQAGAWSLSAEAEAVLRVEAGLPGPEGELVEAYTPLETGLAEIVSGSKGCYTGQEVLARQVTYDKVTRLLAGLRLEGPVAVGTAVWAEGKPAGDVTSAVVSPRFGPLALAVVRRPHHAPGTRLRVGLSAEGGVEAEVVPLPFVG